MGPGNTNLRSRLGTGWVLPLPAPTQYRTTPGTTPPRTLPRYAIRRRDAAYGSFEVDQGDPRGGKRTAHPRGRSDPARSGCVGPAATLRHCWALPPRLLASILHIPQYFSVFLSISQLSALSILSYISVISQLYLSYLTSVYSVISQYFSVFISIRHSPVPSSQCA